MPALNRVKKQAKAVVCQSNLRQWGLVWAMYTEANDDTFPHYVVPDWMDWVREYYAEVDELIYCPTTTRTMSEGAPVRYASSKTVGEIVMAVMH
ncbi:unnamed protein product [marine sediment metagenome]|uniref:Uncharacterized protein n=1 Tax=marine sediment metagenome TaxID=412755 RepID=X1BBP3_9ZZZZ